MLTERQFPFTEPYGLASSPLRSKGPTAEALKRFFGRMGHLAWTDYDQHYNKALGNAMSEYKDDHGLPNDPSYGQLVWSVMRKQKVPKSRPHAGEYAFDFYSRKLVQDEAKIENDSDEEALVMRYIREFWLAAINNEEAWHYDQARKIVVDVNPRAISVRSDCSGTCIQAVRYAGKKAKVAVNDPAKQDFSGWGNTDLFEDDWPKIGAPFRIGDMAHFHSPRHVIMCIKAGTIDTAEWGSNGWEGAPDLVRLRSYERYPDEFMFVVRPQLIKEEV